MAITVDFILRASAAQFTRATAQINNGMASIKQSLKRFDVGNGLKSLIGVGGVIQGFRSAIGYAQELRAEAEKLGKPLDNNVRSVAELGDNFAVVGKWFKQGLVDGLAFFTKTGEAAGSLINRLKGVSAEQEKLAKQTEKDADAAEKRLAKSRETNSPEKVSAERAKAEDKMSTSDVGKRYAYLTNQEQALRKELEATGKQTVRYYEIQSALADVLNEKKKIGAGWDKEAEDTQDKKNTEARKELKLAEQSDKEVLEKKKELIKKFAPSVDELAAMDVGTGIGGEDPRLRARRVMQDEERARVLFSRGDVKGGLALAQSAQATREALESGGNSGDGGQLTQEKAKTAFEEALNETNTELENIKDALKGIIKAQK